MGASVCFHILWLSLVVAVMLCEGRPHHHSHHQHRHHHHHGEEMEGKVSSEREGDGNESEEERSLENGALDVGDLLHGDFSGGGRPSNQKPGEVDLASFQKKLAAELKTGRRDMSASSARSSKRFNKRKRPFFRARLEHPFHMPRPAGDPNAQDNRFRQIDPAATFEAASRSSSNLGPSSKDAVHAVDGAGMAVERRIDRAFTKAIGAIKTAKFSRAPGGFDAQDRENTKTWREHEEDLKKAVKKPPRVTTAPDPVEDLSDVLQGCDSSKYLQTVSLLDGRYILNWVLEDRNVRICVTVNATEKLGWIGFGVADAKQNMTMKNADLIIGRYINSTWDVTDYWADGKDVTQIRADETRGGKNSVSQIGGGRAGSFGVLRFVRALETGDSWDNSISATAPTRIMVAYSDRGSDELSYHGHQSRHNAWVSFGRSASITTATSSDKSSTDAARPTITDSTAPPATKESTTISTTTTTDSTTTEATTSSSQKSTSTLVEETAPPLEPETQSPTAPQLWTVFSIFRGGVRTPRNALPNTLEDWKGQGIPVGLNRITSEGVIGMNKLGRTLGNLYRSIIASPKGFPDPSMVSTRATDHPWSMLSAQALLRGMFPGEWVDKGSDPSVPRVFPIKVNVDKDDLLLLAPRNCPLYRYELDEIIQSEKNPDWKALQDEAGELLEQFKALYTKGTSPLAATDISLKNWEYFYDPVECYRANNLGSPLSPEQQMRILKIGDKLERISYPRNYGGLLGGNLMTSILNTMRLAVNSSWNADTPPWQRMPRLYLFSGHKETLSATFAMLNHTIEQVPGFGDRIDLRLWKDPVTKVFKVNVTSVARDNWKAIEVCPGQLACPFEKFQAAMAGQIQTDWGLKCQRRESIQCLEEMRANNGDVGDDVLFVLSPINDVWYISTGVAVLLVAALAILIFWKWRRRAQSDDVPEEIPLQPMKSRPRPKQFTLE